MCDDSNRQFKETNRYLLTRLNNLLPHTSPLVLNGTNTANIALLSKGIAKQ